MSYIDQTRRPSLASMAGVVAIHSAIGAALVLGLSVSGALPQIITRTGATNIPIDPPSPPPDPVESPKTTQTDPIIFAPKPKTELTPVSPPDIPTLGDIPDILPPVSSDSGRGIEILPPSTKPGFDPVSAKTKNDPSRWLSNSDYRPAWIRRELTGLAKFRLDIAANGRVTSCSITGSTGHPELDQATCELVSKRARFEPARGTSGEPVAGAYSGAVMWELPE